MPPPTTLQKAPALLVAKPSGNGKVQFAKITKTAGHRIVLYGTGGIGKTTMACSAPGAVAFFDLDESLPTLQTQLDGKLPLVVAVASWADLRAALQSDGWDDVKTIVIDSLTKAEEMAVAHTLATKKLESGTSAKSVEDYGYGKGYGFVFDTFLPILADIDLHIRAGRNVILICHECTTTVPNPSGDDYLRYEPRLQSPNSGKASIRHRVKEWADHVLFIGYDIAIDKKGVAQGSGTRTVWPAELPHCMAKSRSTQTPISDPINVWSEIVK